MSEHVEPNSVAGKALTQAVIAEMLLKNFESLPEIEQKLFKYGPVYLGGNAGLAGLISNSLYRRAMNIRPAAVASGLPMAVLPFLTTCALYHGTVSDPLLTGNLSCPICAPIRGALVGLVGGALYPILLALPLNVSLATKYSTTPMPEKAAMFRFSVDLSRPVLRKMRAVMVLQAFFGAYLGNRHFQTYAMLAKITFGRSEELLEED